MWDGIAIRFQLAQLTLWARFGSSTVYPVWVWHVQDGLDFACLGNMDKQLLRSWCQVA